MLVLEGGILYLEGPVTFDTVPELAEAAQEHLRAGAEAIDFGKVTEVDSAAVALALDWLRQAAARNVGLQLRNLPPAMDNLARLYGVTDLLLPAAPR